MRLPSWLGLSKRRNSSIAVLIKSGSAISRCALLGVLRERDQAVADQVGGRFVPGIEQENAIVDQLGRRSRAGPRIPRAAAGRSNPNAPPPSACAAVRSGRRDRRRIRAPPRCLVAPLRASIAAPAHPVWPTTSREAARVRGAAHRADYRSLQWESRRRNPRSGRPTSSAPWPSSNRSTQFSRSG